MLWSPTLGIVVQGALIGSLTALFAVGIALVYRANRIVNFAQGDLGAVPAIFAILLLAKDAPGGAPNWMTGLPYPVAFVIGLVAAIFLGFVVERTLINRFCRAPRLVLTVATIGIAQLLTALALFMPEVVRLQERRAGPTLNPPFDVRVEIGGVFFDDNDLMVFIVVPLVLLALALFLRYTRVGIAIRAAAERSDRAVDARRSRRTRAGDGVGHHDRARVRHRVPPRGRRRASRSAARSASRCSCARSPPRCIGRMDNFPRIAAAAVGLGIVEQAIVFDTGRDLYVFPVLFVDHRRRRCC